MCWATKKQNNTKGEDEMKKKVSATLLAALLATSTILSGCGAQETISMGTGSMQTSSMGESVKEEKQDTAEITDIQWIMKDGSEFWHKYGTQSDEGFAIDEGMIVGKVVYSDGNEMEIEPERVTGTLMGYGNSCKINITYRDRVYEVSSLNPWGDSENPDELAAANSGRQVLIPSGSGSDGEVADVSGSVVLNPEGAETVSDSETSASTESTGEGFATLDEFYASDMYRKLEDIFAKERFQRDGIGSEKDYCGYTEYELWTLFPLFLEEQGRLSELSKLESINIRTVDENDEYAVFSRDSDVEYYFFGIYYEVMSPYGKDTISLAAEWQELKHEVSGWFYQNVEYYIGGTYEVLDKLVLADYDFTGYEEDASKLYCVEITRVLPKCDLDLHGHTLEDMGYEDYSIGTKVYYDFPFPKEVSRSDWGIPEEGTVLDYDGFSNMRMYPDSYFDDWE